MNKRQAKKVARKPSKLGKAFATAVELVRFRQNVAKANKRIARLEKEGLEPVALSNLKSTIDGDRIRIPRGKALTKQAYLKIKAITERFLGAATSKVKAAREGERIHRERFHEQIVKMFDGEINTELEQRLYYAIGDLDIKNLTEKYDYEEIKWGAYQLENVGIKATTDTVERVLQTNLEYMVSDELQRVGVPVDGSSLRDYVDFAIQNGIEAAVRLYQEDQEEE